MPYLHGPGFINDLPLTAAKYRFNWTSPIAVAPHGSRTRFTSAPTCSSRPPTAGRHWTAISGDLTRNDKSKQELSGGPVNHDISRRRELRHHPVAHPRAHRPARCIWVGTDDGLVQVTRDGGKNWTN